MTIAQMHTAVKLGVDKSSALQLPAFEDEEIDHFLNKEIEKFVDGGYTTFEETQDITESLKTLVENTIIAITTVSVIRPYHYNASLSSLTTYRYMLSEEADIRYTDPISSVLITKRQGITECTHESYRQFIDNPYSEHVLHYGEAKPLRLFEKTSVLLVSDGNYSVVNYVITYIKNPATVSLSGNVSCDLPEKTHRRIVDLTVSTLLENIESNRAQGFEQRRLIQQ